MSAFLLLFCAVIAVLTLSVSAHADSDDSRFARRRHTWNTAWGATWASATAIQGAGAAITKDGELRKDLLVGAGSASLGLIPTWIAPSTFHPDWTAHAGNVAVNAATALVMGMGFHHWASGLLSFAVGVPVGELMIYTFPKSPTATSGVANSNSHSVALTAQGLALSFQF